MEETWILILIPFTIILVAIALVNKNECDESYKRGQVDALTGKVRYTLVEFEDGVRGWYKTSELKDLKEYKHVNK